jgi:hypothetical protein
VAGGQVVGRARVVLDVDKKRFNRDFGDAEERTHRMSRALGTALKAGAVAGGAALVGTAYAAKRWVDAAKEAEVSQGRMQQQLRALGIDYDKHAAQIEKVIQRQSKLAALDDEELQASFTQLVRVTKDVNRALELNALAADVARGKNISLEAATGIVTKAALGQVGALRRQGIDIPKVTDAQDKLRASKQKVTAEEMNAAKAADDTATRQRAIAALQTTFAGQAEKYGKSGAAAQERVGVAVENLEEALGKKLLPVLARVLNTVADWVARLSESERVQEIATRVIEELGTAFERTRAVIARTVEIVARVISFFDRHRTLLTLLIGVLASATAGLIAYNTYVAITTAATSAWAARQWILNAALTANPIGLVIAAVAALVIGIIIAWKRSETFRTVVTGAFNAVRNSALTAVSFILGLFDKWLGAYELLFHVLGKLRGKFGAPFRAVEGQIGRARDRVRELKEGVDSLRSRTVDVNVRIKIGGRTHDTAHGIKNDGVVGAVSAAASAWGAQNAMALAGTPTGSSGGLQPYILDELAIGQNLFGLHLSSGVRPGARTSTGNVSLHSVGGAIDMVGPPEAMAMYAQAVAGRPGIAEVIYTPVGAWYPGAGWTRPTGSVAAGHYDHVHVGARGDGIIGVSSSNARRLVALGDGLIGDGVVPPGTKRRAARKAIRKLPRRGARKRLRSIVRRLPLGPGEIHEPFGGATSELPAWLEEAIFDAEATETRLDDIAARRRAIDFLNGQLGVALDASERLPIKREIRRFEDEISELQKETEGPSGAEQQARIEQEARSFLGAFFGQQREWGSDIALARGPGATKASRSGSDGGRSVVNNFYFNKPPEDLFPLMRSAEFAAGAVLG